MTVTVTVGITSLMTVMVRVEEATRETTLQQQIQVLSGVQFGEFWETHSSWHCLLKEKLSVRVASNCTCTKHAAQPTLECLVYAHDS